MNDSIFNTLIDLGFWTFLKIIVLIPLFLYAVFAFVLVRQEHLMAKVVELKGFPLLKTAVFIHFIAAIAVFVLAIIFL